MLASHFEGKRWGDIKKVTLPYFKIFSIMGGKGFLWSPGTLRESPNINQYTAEQRAAVTSVPATSFVQNFSRQRCPYSYCYKPSTWGKLELATECVSNVFFVQNFSWQRCPYSHCNKLITFMAKYFNIIFFLQEDLKNRNIIVLTGRVHPGESPSSWIMRGIIEHVTGNSFLEFHPLLHTRMW